MKRHELLKELSGHVLREELNDLTYEPTALLRGTLVAAISPAEEHIAPERPTRTIEVGEVHGFIIENGKKTAVTFPLTMEI